MYARYRYRLYPTDQQVQSLAEAFGCARWVYNECLVIRERAFEAGESLKAKDVQHRAVTLSKREPDKAWLKDVASVVLVQACNDSRKAYQNWFDSMSGRRRGRKVGHPKFRTRWGRQSIRFCGDRFGVRGGRLFLSKIGHVKVKWSRELPSTPSSVTVFKEPDGRYYATFVVQRPDAPLPPVERNVGIDLGITSFAALAYSDGTTELIPNQRYFRQGHGKLRRAQRSVARKQPGSANRRKAAVKLARLFRATKERRGDHHHKLSTRLISENQAIGIEDLGISGLLRGRLRGSLYDVGWQGLLALLAEKAERHHREVVKIGRFEPTSQVCSSCGVNDGKKPLKIRNWVCVHCGAVHDRDINAAKNILVAAGLAETRNACRAPIRPDSGPARSDEAGTHRSVA